MNKFEIVIAANAAQFDEVRQLCRDFVAWVMTEFPEHRQQTEAYFEPVRWEKTLAELSDIHARPKGAMLLGYVDGKPAGCFMYHEMEPGIAELKRLFVSPAARGTGLGRALVEQSVALAKVDGYHTVRLDSVRFLTAAVALYEGTGFVESEPTFEIPDHARDLVIFMERAA